MIIYLNSLIKKNMALFLSFDVEADGPVPGLYSLLSIGLAGYDEQGNLQFEYEANLLPEPNVQQHPDTMLWWATQPEAWKYVTSNQRNPQEVFEELKEKLQQLSGKYKIIPIALPCSFDWMWLAYYFHKYTNCNPLGHRCFDMRSYIWGISRNQLPDDSFDLDPFRNPNLPHTHKALDDAKEQGMIFINIWKTRNTLKC